MTSVSRRAFLRPISIVENIQVELIAGVFVALGIAAVVTLFITALTNPAIYVDGTEAGAVAWNFTRTIGILRPALAVMVMVLLFRLARRLHRRESGAARWARTVLTWLLLIDAVVVVQVFWGAFSTTSPLDSTTPLLRGLIVAFPWVMIGLVLAAVYALLRVNFHLFHGEESLYQSNTRKAWNLLMPVVLIFGIIAVAPLEQVFLSSLTNEQFDDSTNAQYIGLSNYGQLLGIRLDRVPCIRGTDGTCQTVINDAGETVTLYPRVREFADSEYRAQRFRPVQTFDLFGERYLFSARDYQFLYATLTTIVFTAAAILLQLVLGLGIAMILASKLRGIGLLRLGMLIPLAIPTMIATQFWEVMLREDGSGLVNFLLMQGGIIDQPQAWLLRANLQIPAVILVVVWKETPTMALLLLPGLLVIPKEVYQAAYVDGANRWQQFWRITLPMLRPTIGVALILRTMVTLRVFDIFDIMLGRLRFSMSTYAYEQLIQQQQLGYSSAVSVTIFLIILFFTLVYVRTLRIDEV